MEPRKIETPVESRSETKVSLPAPSDRKRRFQIIKLEERIAPGDGKGNILSHGHTKCWGG